MAPGKPLVDAQEQLEEDGCLLVEGLCDPEFVAHLLEVSLGRSDRVISAPGRALHDFVEAGRAANADGLRAQR